MTPALVSGESVELVCPRQASYRPVFERALPLPWRGQVSLSLQAFSFSVQQQAYGV